MSDNNQRFIEALTAATNKQTTALNRLGNSLELFVNKVGEGIDLIGPYELIPYKKRQEQIKLGKITKRETQLHCLTMIDPATGWFEPDRPK